jgi:hypothetical protein
VKALMPQRGSRRRFGPGRALVSCQARRVAVESGTSNRISNGPRGHADVRSVRGSPGASSSVDNFPVLLSRVLGRDAAGHARRFVLISILVMDSVTAFAGSFRGRSTSTALEAFPADAWRSRVQRWVRVLRLRADRTPRTV